MHNGINHFKTIKELIDRGLLRDEGNNVYIMNDNRQYTVNNPQGSAFSFGDNSTNKVVNNNNGMSEDLLMNLLKEIDVSNLKSEEKEELKELVEAAQDASEAENPKKSVIKRMLEASKGIIDTVTNSPALIDAYTKWVQFLQNPPTL